MSAQSFIVTRSGIEFSLSRPLPSMVRIEDIAWHLAFINRFCGATLRPISVAEHSLLVAEIAERELGLDVHGQFAALMHDAHEAYAGDMHTPGKRAIGTRWYEFEGRIENAVRSAFALHIVARVHSIALKRADLVALATEKRDLLPDGPTPWSTLQGIEPIGWVRLDSAERKAMGWEDWRDRWLDRYHELDYARNDAFFPRGGHA